MYICFCDFRDYENSSYDLYLFVERKENPNPTEDMSVNPKELEIQLTNELLCSGEELMYITKAGLGPPFEEFVHKFLSH